MAVKMKAATSGPRLSISHDSSSWSRFWSSAWSRFWSALWCKFWLFYFLFTIGLIGLFSAYAMSIPIYIMGRLCGRWSTEWDRKLTNRADHVLGGGVRLLMAVQPWLKAEIDLKLPVVPAGEVLRGRLLVSNHRSHLDAFILLSRVPGIRIFAKQTLFYVPLLGMMMRMSRQIPVAHDINAFFDAMNTVRERLRTGSDVHIFPEMTRCAPGQIGTRNFSALPFLIAIQERVPVIPIVFAGTDGAWPKNRFGLSFRHPVQARSLEAIDSTQYSRAEDLRREVRARINAALAVSELGGA